MTQHLGTQRKEFYSRNKVSLKLIPSADTATEYEVSDVRKREIGDGAKPFAWRKRKGIMHKTGLQTAQSPSSALRSNQTASEHY